MNASTMDAALVHAFDRGFVPDPHWQPDGHGEVRRRVRTAQHVERREQAQRVRVELRHGEGLVAAGLRSTLGGRFEVLDRVAFAAHGSARAAAADVIVADYRQGMALLREGAKAPARVLILGTEYREAEVRSALDAGTGGYALLDCDIGELEHGIALVASGSRFVCESVARRQRESGRLPLLSAREHEVLKLLAEGSSDKAIARSLGIALATVKSHTRAIMMKLDVYNRTQAVRVALDRGLV